MAEFHELVEPYRRELHVHCYRMLGSIQDAEDALQDVMLAAWRGLDRFEGRASLRAWLYRIATNRCLNMLRDAGRRPRTAQPLPFEPPEPTRLGEVTWLEPYPDPWIEEIADPAPTPQARYELKEAMTLAFVTALQRLSPRQRAVLVLREVLGFRAAEVADMLEASEVSVNSALQRARTALEDRRPVGALPPSPRRRELLDRFAAAFEDGDVDRVVALLSSDAWLTMPPEPHEYHGRAAIGAFLAAAFTARGGEAHRLVPTGANTQPAFGHYVASRAGGLLVLGLDGDRICAITRFDGAGILAPCGLPATLT